MTLCCWQVNDKDLAKELYKKYSAVSSSLLIPIYIDGKVNIEIVYEGLNLWIVFTHFQLGF